MPPQNERWIEWCGGGFCTFRLFWSAGNDDEQSGEHFAHHSILEMMVKKYLFFYLILINFL